MTNNRISGVNTFSDLASEAQLDTLNLINKEVFQVKAAPVYLTAKTERERVQAAVFALYGRPNPAEDLRVLYASSPDSFL